MDDPDKRIISFKNISPAQLGQDQEEVSAACRQKHWEVEGGGL